MSYFQNFQNAISPLKYTVWSGDSCICNQLDTLYKVMGLEIQLGSFGVTGVKRSVLPKKLFLNKLYGIVMELMHIRHLDTLYKSYGSRNSAGVIWGQKVIFTKNVVSPLDYMVWS